MSLHKKWSFSLRISSINGPNLDSAYLVTFTEEILNGRQYITNKTTTITTTTYNKFSLKFKD